MNIEPICSNINFGKTLLSSANVRKTDSAGGDSFEKVNLVEYDPDDFEDFKRLNALKTLWGKGAKWITEFLESFKMAGAKEVYKLPDGSFIEKNGESPVNYYFWGLEDENENVLVLAEMAEITEDSEDFENDIEIELLQAAPDELYGTKGRHHKGLGKVLVSKIVERAKAKGRDSIVALSANDGFWNHIPYFEKGGCETDFILKSENFDDFIDYANS